MILVTAGLGVVNPILIIGCSSYDPMVKLTGWDDLLVVNGFVNGPITTGYHRLAG